MDNQKILMLLGILALVGTVSAFDINHFTRLTYNWNPLEDVKITLFCNDTNVSIVLFSDSAGESPFNGIAEGNYTITAEKAGLQTEIAFYYFNETTDVYSYMAIETASMIRLNYADLTFGGGEWCFYYEDNGRLLGCYNINDTIYLTENNYTAYPKISIFQQAGLFSGAGGLLSQLFLFIIVLGLIGLFLMSGVLIIYWGLKKIR